MIRRAVVSGGLGFIGSHVAEAVLQQGGEVLLLDDLSTGKAENEEVIFRSTGKRPQVFHGSICSEEAAKAVISFQPEVVFHLAAQVNVRKSVADPCFDATTNIIGTVRLLDACRAAKISKFIFASTGGAIYGEQESFPANESHRTRPESQYGVSKRAAELYLEHYAHAHGLGVVSLRFSNVYGPRQNPKGEAGVVAVFSERLMSGEALKINGNGEQTRDFIFVKDVVSANMLAANSIQPGQFRVYNVGRGVEVSVNEVAEVTKRVWESLNPGQTVEFTYGPALPGEQMRSVVDSTLLQRELGWSPSTDFSSGLTQTIKSYLQK